jgi:hypothetical protein
MPKPLCIFHKNCLDGCGAAAVVARKEPDCDFLPMQYGMKLPTVLGRKVYMVDFGLPVEDMRALRAQADEVIWIDHHASQQGVRATLGWGTLDTTECGTSLAWKCLFPGQPAPPVVAYIKDKDLWQWQLPDSRAIAAGLAMTFRNERFQGILEVDLDEMARKGRPALAALATRVADAVTGGVAVERPYGLEGMRALALRCNQDQNEIGDHICLPVTDGGLGYDLAILYYRKQAGTWVHSLRANGVDCAAIAAARGGGGHPSSACYLAPIAFTDSDDCPKPVVPIVPVAPVGSAAGTPQNSV